MKYNRRKLITIITKNRAEHKKVYDKAMEGYKSDVRAKLICLVQDIDLGKEFNTFINLPKPEEHLKDYDRILGMLELTTQSDVDLDENKFAQYVQDDWAWKKGFEVINSSYIR